MAHIARLEHQDEPGEPQHPSAEDVRAALAHYLLQGGEQAAAALILGTELILSFGDRDEMDIIFVGPRDVYEIFAPFSVDPRRAAILNALNAIKTTYGWLFVTSSARLVLPKLTSEDHKALIDLALGRHVHNQAAGVPLQSVTLWQNLRFRSVTEARIAEALDRAGALFWPNCRARLGEPRNRRNLEADFLVLWKGHLGILEIDGEPFHPPERRAEEQNRDRVWHRHGVKVIQHYDAKPAYERPNEVVVDFFRILESC